LGLPFAIVLASDDYAHGRSLFTELSACTGPILGGRHALLDHVKASKITSKLSGYLIHSMQFNSTEPTSQFWQFQAAIVTQFRITRLLFLLSPLLSTPTTTAEQYLTNLSQGSNRTGGLCPIKPSHSSILVTPSRTIAG
jgi:hypothetical protein